MKHIMVFSTVLFLVSTVFGQWPDTLWTRHFSGANDEWAQSVRQTYDDGFIAAGVSAPHGSSDFDGFAVRTSPVGQTVWIRTYHVGNYNWINRCFQTPDSGFIFGGWTAGSNSDYNTFDMLLILANSAGDTLWTRALGTADWDEAKDVQRTADGGYILSGFSDSGFVSEKYLLVKTDRFGDMQWQRTYLRGHNCSANGVLQTSDGGYILAGESVYTSSDIWVVRTNSAGDTLWTRTYGGDNDDYAQAIVSSGDGGFLIVGYRLSGSQLGNMFALRIDSLGNQIWLNAYGGGFDDRAFSVRRMYNGDYAIAGNGRSGGNIGMYVIRIHDSGSLITSNVFGAGGSDVAYSVDTTVDHQLIIGGVSSAFGTNSDLYLVRTTSLEYGTVTGTVRLESNGEVLPGVKVWAEGAPDSAVTGQYGNYTLSVLTGTYSLRYHFPNYCDSITAPMRIFSGDILVVNAWLAQAAATFSVSSLNVESLAGRDDTTYFELGNAGGYCPLTFSITDTSDWILCKPDSGVVPPGDSLAIEVILRASLLPPGAEREGEIVVTHCASEVPRVIPVLFYVSLGTDDPQTALPKEFALHECYPNPFNPTTTISFSLPSPSKVSVEVFDILGREAWAMQSAPTVMSAGEHSVVFDGTGLASGIYFVRMKAENFVKVQKMMLLR